jgi:2-polyprenyl-6-methoxyphenol hydroxylase-like FAD-dependent oxidoreductase
VTDVAMRVVIVGAGPIGLATSMLLAADGHEVEVFEKDGQGPPATSQQVWESWRRFGVSQFRQAHYMQARFRHLLDAELPAVRDRLEDVGARRCNVITALLGSLPGQLFQEGDARFETITGRRPIVESAFAMVAEECPGVAIRRGVAVTEPIGGASVLPGVPHISGVRTAEGVDVDADLVIDAMGRRSKLTEWVQAVGGRPPYEEASDAGFAYYTRHYRSKDGNVPEWRGPVGTDIGTVRVVTLPADNGTWTLALVPVAGDPPFKALKHNAVWERVFGAIPHASHWLDGEPVCDVIAMAGVLDRRRRIVVDGQPVTTGLVPVGDAWACTNPTAGRGMTLGLAHAVALRDTIRANPDDPAQLVEVFDSTTERSLTPWYHDQVERDNQRARNLRAEIDGQPAKIASSDLGTRLMLAARFDSDAARGFLDVFSCLALPSEVVDRPGMRDKLVSLNPAELTRPAGPSREQLIALTE